MTRMVELIFWGVSLPVLLHVKAYPSARHPASHVADRMIGEPCSMIQVKPQNADSPRKFAVHCKRSRRSTVAYGRAVVAYEDFATEIVNKPEPSGLCGPSDLKICLDRLRVEEAARARFSPTFFLLGALFEAENDYLCATYMFATAVRFGDREAADRQAHAEFAGSNAPFKMIARCEIGKVNSLGSSPR